ncbi:MAG TPA: potassium channel protein [Gemmataceae bacterium]|nr:potassium channel protein [Gemmataceae bacterium]
MNRLPRRFWILASIPVALVGVGTAGYRLIESETYSTFDALYMTIITLTTIGFEETHKLSTAGRVFTIFLILSGVFTLVYSASETIRSIVSGEVATALGKRRMERTLAQLKNHTIVCGYGRMGRLVCKEFSRLGKPFVIVDVSAQELGEFSLPHGVPLVGDATSDELLKQAGILRAHSLVTVMDSDAENLFTTLSARLLNPQLMIVSRVEGAQSEEKLIRAGANRVISPYEIGGTRVAQAVLKPTVVDFIELTTRTEHLALQLEEAKIEPKSALIGVNLKDSKLRAEHQVIIVAIKKKQGHMMFNPPAETVLEEADILVAIGSREHLDHVSRLAHG